MSDTQHPDTNERSSQEGPAAKPTDTGAATRPTAPSVRVEVVANRSVQEDFFERLNRRGVGAHYTLFPEVQGDGEAGPRRGDHIWPEENFVYVTYVDTEEARAIKNEVEELKRVFENEGIRFFAVQGLTL